MLRICRLITLGFIIGICLALSACQPQDEKHSASGPRSLARRDLPRAERMKVLENAFPWDRYVSNDFLPDEYGNLPKHPTADTSIKKLVVALPWLQNDQTPALWFGMSRGYFQQEGLEIEIVPGGPGRDNLLFLLSGQVDIAIASCATGIIRLLASETGGEILAVGALQKAYPYAYIALDPSISTEQVSSREMTVDDFRDKTLGMTPGGEAFLAFALDALGLESNEIRIRKAGSSLVPLTSGVFDFYTTMSDNNPRRLEAMGYHNWMLWEFRKHGWVDYHNVISVLPSTLASDPDSIRAFLRALDRSLRELLAMDPLEAAHEILPFVEETGLTPQLIARRLELQRPITIAVEDEPLLHMTQSHWVEAASILWRLGVIDLPAQGSAQ